VAVVVAEEPAQNEDDGDDDDNEDIVADQAAELLKGFESSESEGEEDEGMALDELPSAPTDQKLRKKLQDASGDSEGGPGVLYVGYVSRPIFPASSVC